jgi:hypothetical protein
LSRIKQEEQQCVWDQQDLAERDIPTDPNSGEKDVSDFFKNISFILCM